VVILLREPCQVHLRQEPSEELYFYELEPGRIATLGADGEDGGQWGMMVPGGRARGQNRNFGEKFHSDAR